MFSLLLLLVPGLGHGRGQLWSNKERSVLLNQWSKSHFRHFTGVCKNDSAGHPPGSNTDCVLRARLTTTELYTTELFLLSRRIEKGGGAAAGWKLEISELGGCGRAGHPPHSVTSPGPASASPQVLLERTTFADGSALSVHTLYTVHTHCWRMRWIRHWIMIYLLLCQMK